MSQKVRKPKKGKRQLKRNEKMFGTKGIDQIKQTNIEYNEDLAGNGLFPCQMCDRQFIDQNSLIAHNKSKKHKRRMKELMVVPYSVKESEICAGLK